MRRSFYEKENKKNLPTQRMKEIEKNLFELDKIFLNLKSIMIMLILNTKE